jgi:hypothetical protein
MSNLTPDQQAVLVIGQQHIGIGAKVAVATPLIPQILAGTPKLGAGILPRKPATP